MAINLRKAAQNNATSTVAQGRKYTKEELNGRILSIAKVELIDKDVTKNGRPVCDENGQIKHMMFAQIRFAEITDGYFRGFGAINNMVKEWTNEATLDEINSELSSNPLKIKIHPFGGNSNAWTFDLVD